jgi:hypothetical protein
MRVMRQSAATFARQDAGSDYQGADEAAQQMSVYLTALSKFTDRKTLTYCFREHLFDGNDHCLKGIQDRWVSTGQSDQLTGSAGPSFEVLPD